jgi:TM2 domain-containing membrane protein YozV
MKFLPIAVALFWLAVVPLKTAKAQNDSIPREVPDSIMEKKHSPTKATIMSACIPGLGQIYNHKIWKVPIIYAGFGVLAYLIVFNANYYMDFKCAYIESRNGDTAGNYAYLVNRYTADQLISAREYYRRNLEISCLISGLWYILNILDAVVDAHLYTFNINKNLTMKVEPAVIVPQASRSMSGGIKLSIHF